MVIGTHSSPIVLQKKNMTTLYQIKLYDELKLTGKLTKISLLDSTVTKQLLWTTLKADNIARTTAKVYCISAIEPYMRSERLEMIKSQPVFPILNKHKRRGAIKGKQSIAHLDIWLGLSTLSRKNDGHALTIYRWHQPTQHCWVSNYFLQQTCVTYCGWECLIVFVCIFDYYIHQTKHCWREKHPISLDTSFYVSLVDNGKEAADF